MRANSPSGGTWVDEWVVLGGGVILLADKTQQARCQLLHCHWCTAVLRLPNRARCCTCQANAPVNVKVLQVGALVEVTVVQEDGVAWGNGSDNAGSYGLEVTVVQEDRVA